MHAGEVSILDQLKSGDIVLFRGFCGGCDQGYRHRLLSMGLVPGVTIQFLRKAPLGDPFLFMVNGSRVGLRSEEISCLDLYIMGRGDVVK